MSRIQEDVTKQGWDMILKFLGTGSEFIYQIAHEGNVMLKQGSNFAKEVLVALINKQKEAGKPIDATAQMLKRVEKGESINTISVAEEDVADIKKYFQEKGVLYNVIDDVSDDTKFFMYMSGDSEKVINIISLWQAEKGLVSELKPELFLDNFAKDGVGTISGMDNADLEVFRLFAKEKGLVFASTPAEEQGKYLVIYDPKDEIKVKKIMSSSLWAFSGKEGKAHREQMELYLQYKKKVNLSLTEPEKEIYIVNGSNPEHYVHLTANDLTYYKNSKEILNVSRSSSDFIERGLRVFDGMSQPVLLTREEYEKHFTNGELDKAAIKTVVEEKAKEIPNKDALKEAQKKQNERLERIESKMSLDDENTAGFWIYDDSINFADGGGYEEIEDIDEQVKEDLIDAQERAKQYKFHQVENRSVDYLISEAEKLRKQPEKDTKNKEIVR